MNFKIVTYDNTLIKSAFAGIGQLVDEVQIQLDNEGLRLNALDKSHITFVHLELDQSSFDEYELETPTSINLDTGEFMKVLSRCKPQDILILEADDNNLIVTFEGDATRTFKIRLIDIDYDNPTAPPIDYHFNCELPVKLLKDTLSDISVFSDKLKIKHKQGDDNILLMGNNDFGATTTKYNLELENDSEVNSTYNMDRIKDFMKSEKFSNTIQLKSGVDLPLILEFHREEGVLSYLLAPRIEQEGGA